MNFRVRVPATTSNVGSGFDCFGMAVSMHLEVDVRAAPALTVTAEGADVPLDRHNLVVRTFLDALGSEVTEPALALHLRNRIPLARGLGSSATARVAGLALAEVWKRKSLQVDRAAIARAASVLEGHPDNATPAVFGGFCISAGDDFERVELDDREYLVVIPAVEIHTEEARAALPKSVSLVDAVFNLQRAALAGARIAQRRHLGALAPFEDRLHQRHRLALEPRLERAFASISKHAAVEALFLPGSGPTLFVLAQDLEAASVVSLAELKRQGLAAEAQRVRVDNAGLTLEAL